MKLYPIVEGHGEVPALPILLRRLLNEAQVFDVSIAEPMRRTQAQLRGEASVRDAVDVTLLNPDCAAILVLFDGEDGCPAEEAQRVRHWAREAARTTPCEVVVAYREYETWFLTALESLRGCRGIALDAVAPAQPEARRDAKSWLEEWMPRDRSYSETLDQPALSATFDLATAFRRSRSFRKLVASVGELLAALDRRTVDWPPRGWIQPPTEG